jgi:hypothetical protein
MGFIVLCPHLDPYSCIRVIWQSETSGDGRLTRERNAEYENDDGYHEDDGRYPAHRMNVVEVDGRVTSAAICFSLDIVFRELSAGGLTLSVPGRGFVTVLFWAVVPVRKCEVESRYKATGYVELLERALLDNPTLFVERNNMIAIRKSLCYRKSKDISAMHGG